MHIILRCVPPSARNLSDISVERTVLTGRSGSTGRNKESIRFCSGFSTEPRRKHQVWLVECEKLSAQVSGELVRNSILDFCCGLFSEAGSCVKDQFPDHTETKLICCSSQGAEENGFQKSDGPACALRVLFKCGDRLGQRQVSNICLHTSLANQGAARLGGNLASRRTLSALQVQLKSFQRVFFKLHARTHNFVENNVRSRPFSWRKQHPLSGWFHPRKQQVLPPANRTNDIRLGGTRVQQAASGPPGGVSLLRGEELPLEPHRVSLLHVNRDLMCPTKVPCSVHCRPKAHGVACSHVATKKKTFVAPFC